MMSAPPMIHELILEIQAGRILRWVAIVEYNYIPLLGIVLSIQNMTFPELGGLKLTPTSYNSFSLGGCA